MSKSLTVDGQKKLNRIFLAVDGVRYDGFTDISVERSIEKMCGTFSFSSTVKESGKNLVDGNSPLRLIQNPIKVQDEVSVFIDDTLVMTGRVEDLTVNYNPTGHTISVSGRDKTGDLIDSSVIQKQYKERNFARLLRLVLDDNGYSGIKIQNNLPTPAILPSDEVVRTEPSDTIFSFLDKYAQRLQVLMLTDALGNIVLATEGDEGVGGALISQKNGENNNIVSANFQVSSRDRFRFVEVFAQSGNSTFSKNSVSQKGSYEDSQITTNRRKIIVAGKATQKNMLDQLAEWNVTVRRARGQRYDCQVVGYYTGRDNGRLWEINKVVPVWDDKADLDGQYLIQGVKYTKSLQGSFTEISVVELGSFTIDPEQKFNFSSKGKKGNTTFFKT